MSDDRLHSEPKLWHWRRDALSTGTFGIVDDVIDGNSMETRWAGIRQPRVVRLAGVDAPGVKEPFGEEALDFLRSMVSRASSRNFSIDEFELAPDKKSATGVVYFNSLPAEERRGGAGAQVGELPSRENGTCARIHALREVCRDVPCRGRRPGGGPGDMERGRPRGSGEVGWDSGRA